MAKIDNAKEKYISKIKNAVNNGYYKKGMANFLGVSEAQIANSAPVKNWEAQMSNPEDKANKWYNNLKAAFGIA